MDSSTLPTFGKKYDFDSVANESLVWSRDVNVSDYSSILGYPRAPAFGVSRNSHFGTPKLALANQQHPCQGAKTCQDKIQEELRFEDYQLGDKGTLAFNVAMNATLGRTQNISPGSSTLQIFGKKYDVNSVANEPLLWSRDANVSDSSAFGSLKATSFCVSNNSRLGTPKI
ncbi:hypothetical protein KY284_003032 [Solanum tuberosum]|nr:hypothetical protein KY284_003032 [Solanum tuberosum]